jgi:hypothetical protein
MRRLLVPFILPPACAWIARHERRILTTGVPLNAAQQADATALGIAHPDRVRLLAVPRVPLPLSWLKRYARSLVGTSFAQTSGLTARYGIYLRAEEAADRQLLAHELAHTRQYERLGGIRPFLHQYLTECLTAGYLAAPMEEEARLAALNLCSPED